jgi:apolipoprotein N-acyltransferase
VFVVVGLLFLVVAVRGTQDALFSLLKSEFTGTGSFIPWAAAIFILGAIGYAKPVKPVADAMIGLVVLGMVLNNKGGIFKQFETQINNPTAPAATSTGGNAAQQMISTGNSLMATPNTPNGMNAAPALTF